MDHPDPKKHQLISFVKSGIRIGSSLGTVVAGMAGFSAVGLVAGLALGYLLAELIGVYEELV